MKATIAKMGLLLLALFAIQACVKEVDVIEDNTSQNVDKQVLIQVPEGFDYSTYKTVKVNINDNTNAIYEVFVTSDQKYFEGTFTSENEAGEIVTEDIYRDDVINKNVLKGVVLNGSLEQTITIPNYCEKVYVRRNDNLRFSGEFVNISNDEINYTHQDALGRNANAVTDFLLAVNGNGDLFQVDILDGSHTYLSEIPMGSYTAAVDQENKYLYSIGRSSPHPLMRYSIDNNTWSTITNIGIYGPRLGFNSEDELLYYSDGSWIRKIDPSTGQIISYHNIYGLDFNSGGDLVFSPDGTLFLCSHGGLYRLTPDGDDYNSVRISSDALPFYPTSLTFDSDGDLWLAGLSGDANLIIMDTVTGSWQYVYGANAANGTNFNRAIHDLTTFSIYSDTPDTTDTDGDGVVDSQDAFPTEANKAFELFTPSKYGTGTIAFEDLWPFDGDYDFNDVALNYRAIAVLNSQNLAVQVDFICKVKSNTAGFINGIGIEIEGLNSNQISNVVGTIYSENYINLESNGTEANQDNAVVILTDNSNNLLNETKISIIFDQPITTETLGAAPFNPFIIVNKARENEVHLPYKSPTSLGVNMVTVEGNNNDPLGNYISSSGYPWAISIIHEFKVPKENVRIYNAYNFFNNWATSGGALYSDWYKDNPGNRNTELIND